MFVFWLVVALAVSLVGLFVWRQRRVREVAAAQRRRAEDLDTLTSWEPQATRVLRPGEQLALFTLARALPDYVVLAQVPLARFIRVPQRNSYTEWLRRVGQLSPDLIVCDTSSRVLAAVEVARADAKPSERAERRLGRMRRVLKSAGIPMHTWTEGQLPTVQKVREQILPKSAASAASVPTDASAPAPRAMRLSEFEDAVVQPIVRRPPIIVDAVEDAVLLREPPPSSWFDEDFDPDSEQPDDEVAPAAARRRIGR